MNNKIPGVPEHLKASLVSDELKNSCKKIYQCLDTGEEIYLYTDIDYKELLIKYIRHIFYCESVTYIYKDAKTTNNRNGNKAIFTDEEINELNKLSK
jgi:hypothetical protein